MSTVASPFGFLCRKHPTGQSRANQYTIAASQAGAMGYGDGVSLDTNGQLIPGVAAADLIGIFAGVNYRDSTGKPTYSKNWPGAIAGATDIQAWVYDDALNVFEVQVASGGSAYVQSVIGAQANLVAGTPNASTGQSTQALNATPVAAGAQGQFRIIGFGASGPYDATLNPFPEVLVQIAQHQYIANKTAI
jgi:hypothetical protein